MNPHESVIPVSALPSQLGDWLPGKRVAVVGLQRTGLALARELARRGAEIVAADAQPASTLGDAPAQVESLGGEVICGESAPAELDRCDLVVVSPGVPFEGECLALPRRRGIPVIGEIELAFRLTTNDIAAVTGTKGKSTTVSMLGVMLDKAGLPHRVGGNIGAPLIGQIGDAGPEDLLIVEVSSFQLESTVLFHPRWAALLNLAEDHLNRHHSLDEYVAAKKKLFANMTCNDRIYLNRDDGRVRDVSATASGLVSWVSLHESVPRGGWLSADGELRCEMEAFSGRLCRAEDLKVPGRHNVFNALVAASMALDYGASVEAVRAALREFVGLEHRLERVAELQGVVYWNDSMATTPLAAAAGLDAMPGATLVLLGGRGKTSDFSSLEQPLRRKAKAALCLGETGPLLADLARRAGVPHVLEVESLELGVREAARLAEPGDHVLLSPACASFDQFRDYAERGERFRNAVGALRGEHR